MTSDDTAAISDRIDSESFAEWYRERQVARNIRRGQPYFNGPDKIPDPERHTPSSLLQCHRKIAYRQENAPAEREKPEGIFWSGRKFEEDVAVPFLRDIVRGDAYVRNGIWVDFEVETSAMTIRFKGTTDPCIVDRDSAPILPTEIKTKDEVGHLTEPNRHHRAQVHVYMRGLSEKYDREVDEAVLIYGSRKTMNVRVFREPFDAEFWEEVVEWAARHTEYRAADELPPDDPEYGWECRYCDYRHRCGRTDQPYSDEGMRGFLPLLADYPRQRVVEYLRAHDDTALTPTLAREYPGLADDHAVLGWSCPSCETSFTWREIDHDPDARDTPVCPECAEQGDLATLVLA